MTLLHRARVSRTKDRSVAPSAPDGYSRVMAMSSGLSGETRDRWLKVTASCYQVVERIGGERFDKRWLPGFQQEAMSLRRLARWGILEHVMSTRRGHRAYWRMPDRDGVTKALRELGYL